MQFLNNGIIEILLQLHKVTGNLGVSILLFTILARTILLPLSLPGIQSQKKMKVMKPELDALKKKFGSDKKALNVAQLELYKKYNLNPLGGCLPQLLQIFLFIVLYNALVKFIHQTEIGGVTLNPQFFWLDLRHPDQTYIFPVLAGLSQLILSVMILPGGETPDIVPNQSKEKAIQEANKKEEDSAEMAASMQQQMLFILPVITVIFAVRFPSGISLYWVAATVFTIVQQWILSGPGGLVTYSRRALSFIQGKLILSETAPTIKKELVQPKEKTLHVKKKKKSKKNKKK
jgi:YidC/Oxa1 family membrane protein insertase